MLLNGKLLEVNIQVYLLFFNQFIFIRPSHNYLTSQERTLALQNSASLRMIYEELFRSNQAIILQTHRIRLNRYYNCFLGNELVNWMITQNKAATR